MPLIGIPDGNDIVLIASNWGGASHPAWYFNLRAHPEVTVAFYGLELIVAVVQAYVFALLTCIYLNDSINLH